MTLPLILLAIPSAFLGLALGLPFGDSTIKHWLEPVFHDVGAHLHGEAGPIPAVRHRRLPDPRQRGRGDAGPRRRHLAVRHRQRRASRRASTPRQRERRDPVLYRARSTSGSSMTSTTSCSSASAAASPRAMWWFDRAIIDGTVNGIGTADPGRRRPPPPDPDRPRPELRAGHRDRADRHRRLVLMIVVTRVIELDGLPILSLIIFPPLIGRGPPRVPARPARPRPLRGARRRARDLGRRRWCCSWASSPADPGFQFTEAVPWIPFFGINYAVGVDGFSLALVVLTTTLHVDQHPGQLRPDPEPGEGVHDLLPHPRGRA